MSSDTTVRANPVEAWSCRGAAVFLIVAAACLRLAYLAYSCPLDLAQDEAHYWDWSRHLDWSYYSKGPLVAYLIRGGCELAGNWSRQSTGTDMLAVRLPAVLCGSLLLAAVYVLTVQVYGRERLALAVVALALTFPMLAAGSSLMTIDAPYTCCWSWALVLGLQAIRRQQTWAWAAAGLLVGLGILAKYTMILWVPSLALFLLTSSEHRRLLFRPGFWVLALVGALCCLPILVWNIQHDWISLWHVSNLAGLAPGQGIIWQGPLIFVGTQFAFLLGFWFVPWVCALVAHRPWKEPDAGRRYLWWMSVPMFALFLAFSFKTGGGEPNWPVTAYISGLVLAAGWIVAQLAAPQRWYRRFAMASLIAACVLGLAVTVLVYRSDWLYPVLASWSGPPTEEQPLPLRRFDPTCRLRGWHTLAAEVDRLRSELEAKGVPVVLAATNWSLPGELGFYCQGHPVVYSIGAVAGDRASQYDLWRPNPVDDPATFAGKTFILVSPGNLDLGGAFATMEPPHVVVHREGGQPVAAWSVVVAHDFRGFRLPATGKTY
jgi:4-amino-4-deoxy-L-arabinose transferase-like glycosyltransferase